MATSKKHESIRLQSLADHITEQYGGNNSACARAYGVERNQVQQWLNAKNPVYVIDGVLVKLVRTAPGR